MIFLDLLGTMYGYTYIYTHACNTISEKRGHDFEEKQVRVSEKIWKEGREETL